MNYITLRNEVTMPQLGFGVFQIPEQECERVVSDALEVGYRHFDTAQAYFNERQVGSAIAKSGIDRADIFITTKVWLSNYGYQQTLDSVYVSLEKLQTDYIDLVLLHQPFSDVYSSWRALEHLYQQGLIRAIGVSNFTPDRYADLSAFNEIAPLVNQIEINPINQQVQAAAYLQHTGCVVESWAPFGEGKANMFTNETIQRIGNSHNKTVAQVILRWLLQRGIVVIPKSSHIERMRENFDVFDFELSVQEMEMIATLDKQTSLFFDHQSPQAVEFFVDLIKQRSAQENK